MTLRTAERVLLVLEFVAGAPHPPNARDVADGLSLNLTTTYHLLNTLLEMGYLTKESDASFRVGGRISFAYQGMVKHFEIGKTLFPIVDQLAAATAETAYLSILSGRQLIVQALVEGTQPVRVSGMYVGMGGSEHVRAGGKAVLAFMNETDRTALLDRSTRDLDEAGRQDVLRELPAELETIREAGWALDDRKFAESVCCVAAPFFASAGQVLGSVSVSAPADRFDASKEQAVEAVLRAARAIGAVLGSKPWTGEDADPLNRPAARLVKQ